MNTVQNVINTTQGENLRNLFSAIANLVRKASVISRRGRKLIHYFGEMSKNDTLGT